jgi:hypothetical protein
VVGYFAVLQADAVVGASNRAPLGRAEAISGIRRCHINLWSLTSVIPGRRLFYFDVGLELIAGTEPVTSFEMLLPFQVEEGRWKGRASTDIAAQDLYDTMSTRPAAELVFGGPVRLEDDHGVTTLGIGDYASPLRLARLNAGGIRRVESADQREDSSHYTVPLEMPVPAGEARYIRMRWRVFGAGPLWTWKRATGGALFDFRVYDVRESRFAESERPLRARMIPIDEINVFLIAPAKYQVATTSPQWKYLRVLEADAWRHYLRGAAYLWLRGAMVVYHWRHKNETNEATPTAPKHTVNPDNPFRVFADLSAPSARSWWHEVTRLALAVAVLAAVVRISSGGYDVRHLPWTTILSFFGLATVLAAISWFERLQKLIARRFLGPRMHLRKLERAVIGKQ